MTTTALKTPPEIPSKEIIEAAGETSRELATILPSLDTDVYIRKEGEGHIKIPSFAMRLLLDILEQMAKGNAVSIVPVHAELTTQQAADILNVSRPYFVKLLDEGKLEHTKVGRHRRIRYDEIMRYKDEVTRDRMEALDELTQQGQELDMGY